LPLFKFELGASAALVPAFMSKHLTIQKAEDLWKVIDSDGRVFDGATSRDEAEGILSLLKAIKVYKTI